MASQNLFKSIQRTTARYLFIISRAIIRILPYPVFRLFSWIFVVFGYGLMVQKKRLTISNLQVAFGKEKSMQEIKIISKECFRNFGRNMVDLIYFMDRPKKTVEKVSIEGKENLEEVLKQGKGAVVLSAHFGAFILMYLRIILEGYPTNVIMRRTRDAEFEKMISGIRGKLGIKTIYALPQRQCIQASIKALRNNELLFILLDQNYGSEGGVFVDFFGRKAATAAGPVVFSNRTEAPIVPMFIVRECSRDKNNRLKLTDRHKIIIDKPIYLKETDIQKDKKEVLEEQVGVLSKVIERYVKQHPYEWGGWMHQRWKTQFKE